MKTLLKNIHSGSKYKAAFISIFIFFSLLFFTSQISAKNLYPFNKSYADVKDITKPLAWLDTKKAISAVGLHRGVLFVPLSFDFGGGRGDGAFMLLNIDDPYNPKTIFDSRNHPEIYHTKGSKNYVGNFSEMHALSFHNDYVLMGERSVNDAGISILDLGPLFDNDPQTKPQIVSRFVFPKSTDNSFYDGFSFSPTWQGGRYVYAPTGTHGLYVIDTTDFDEPKLISHVPRAGLYNQTLRSANIIGDLLILSPAAIASSKENMVLVDVTNPNNPTLINKRPVTIGYQGFVYGSYFYSSSVKPQKKGTPKTLEEESIIIRYNFDDVNNITEDLLAETTRLSKAEYGYVVDDNVFVGHYPGVSKWKVENGKATFETVMEPQYPKAEDYAFISPVGNLTVASSDHMVQSRFNIGVHDRNPDLKGPELRYILPKNGAKNVSRQTKIGISFSDFIDPISLSQKSLVLRKVGTQTPINVTYSHMFGIVNIIPDQPLENNTSYEVLVIAESNNNQQPLIDQVGNVFEGEQRLTVFSTGNDIAQYNASVITNKPLTLGKTATFIANVNSNDDNAELEFAWKFEDEDKASAFSRKKKTSHTFNHAGNHVVTLLTRIKGQTKVQKTSGVQVIHEALNAHKPMQSSTFAFDEKLQRMYVVNPDNNTLSAIDDNNLNKLYEVAVGNNPSSVAIDHNKLWVTNKKDNSISILSSSTGQLLKTISLAYGSAPHGIVILPKKQKAYVVLTDKKQVITIDTNSYKTLNSVKLPDDLRHIAYDAKQKQLILPHFRANGLQGGKVSFVDTKTLDLTKTIELASSFNHEGLANGKGSPNYLGSVALSPSYNAAWLPGKKDNIYKGLKRDGKPLTFDHTVRSMAAKIDLAGQHEVFEQRVDFDNSDMASAAIYSPFGNMVYFATLGSSTIWAIDAYQPSNRFAFDSVGEAPISLALNHNGTHLYIHNFLSRSVSVFYSSHNLVGVGQLHLKKKISVVAKERLVANVHEGKSLFYNSRNPSLSQEGYMSCASCHFDGSHDGRIWDISNMGEGLRNTIDLQGHSGVAHGPLHWSANFDEVHDFELQIRQLNLGQGLIQNTQYPKSAHHPYGSKKSNLSADLDKLSDYVTSLNTYPQSPYRSASGEMTKQAAKGRQHFIDLQCYQCHRDENFTDSAIGRLHNVGTLTPNSGQRLGGQLDGIDTPSLISLWQSEPYLHDGSAPTIINAVERHNDLGAYTSEEKAELIAFLQQIKPSDHIKATEIFDNAEELESLSPKLTKSLYHFEFYDEIKKNKAIGKIISTKTGQNYQYYISTGGDANLFSVDVNTGQIYYKGSNIYDQTTYEFDVKVENNVSNFITTKLVKVKANMINTSVSKVEGGLDHKIIDLKWPHIKNASKYILYVKGANRKFDKVYEADTNSVKQGDMIVLKGIKYVTDKRVLNVKIKTLLEIDGKKVERMSKGLRLQELY